MVEYIEREKAFKLIKEQKEFVRSALSTGAYSKGRNTGLFVAMSVIKNKEALPTADVVKVVRCKDCRMFVENKKAFVAYYKRECKNITVNPDDYCSYGERKEK